MPVLTVFVILLCAAHFCVFSNEIRQRAIVEGLVEPLAHGRGWTGKGFAHASRRGT